MSNPRFVDQWTQYALDCLFLAENTRIDKEVTNLCQKNANLTGQPCFGFLYQAKRFIPAINMDALKKQRNLPGLHIKLAEDVMHFNSDSMRLERDKTQIKQLFFLLLRDCNNEQDVRNNLPECVINLTELKHTYPRMYDGTLRLLPSIRKDYENLLPKIEMYSASYLLY